MCSHGFLFPDVYKPSLPHLQRPLSLTSPGIISNKHAEVQVGSGREIQPDSSFAVCAHMFAFSSVSPHPRAGYQNVGLGSDIVT